MSGLLDHVNERHNEYLNEVGHDGDQLSAYLLVSMPILFECSRINDEIVNLCGNEVTTAFFVKLKSNESNNVYFNKLASLYDRLYAQFTMYFAFFKEDVPTKKDTFIGAHDESELCPHCHLDTFVDTVEGEICSNCGVSNGNRFFGSVGKNISFKETQNITPVPPRFAYKKKSHLLQKLNQLLSKNYKHLKKVVLDEVIIELNKLSIDISLIQIDTIRAILKKLNRNENYGDAYCLLRIIQKKSPIEIDQEVENKLVYLFERAEKAFDECKGDRKNFLSYNYVIYKLLQLLDQTHLLKEIELLKSRERLIDQDSIWKRICTTLDWRYIPTV